MAAAALLAIFIVFTTVTSATCHVMMPSNVTDGRLSVEGDPASIAHAPEMSRPRFRTSSSQVIAVTGHRTVTYVERISRGIDTNSSLVANRSETRAIAVEGDNDVIETCAFLKSSDESIFLVTSPAEPVCTTEEWAETKNATRLRVILIGLEIGRSRLLLTSVKPTGASGSKFNSSSVYNEGCDVIVVPRFLSPPNDPFFLVDAGIQLTALCLLGLRARTVAIENAFMRPGTLVATLLCQIVVVPLLSVGGGVSFRLELHSIICMLYVSCFLSNPLSVMFAVLHHADVELSIVLLISQTALCFGVVPLWFYLYDLLLPGLVSVGMFRSEAVSDGVSDSRVPTSVYSHLAVTLVAVSAPVVVGLLIRRCGLPSTVRRTFGARNASSSSATTVVLDNGDSSTLPPPPSRSLPPSTALDRAVYPVCLLAVVVAAVVSSYRVWVVRNVFEPWSLVIGVLPAALFLPAASFLVGAVGTVHAQGFARAKSAGLAVALTGAMTVTMSATGGSGPDAALVAANAAVFQLAAVTFCGLLFVGHLLSWMASSRYRDLHGDYAVTPWAISGYFYRSFAQRIVHSMIKAGEITFRRQGVTSVPEDATSDKQSQHPVGDLAHRGLRTDDVIIGVESIDGRLTTVNVTSPVRSRDVISASDDATPRSVGFCRTSSNYGGRVLVVACDSMRRTDSRPIHVDLNTQVGDGVGHSDPSNATNAPSHEKPGLRGGEGEGGTRDHQQVSYEFFAPAAAHVPITTPLSGTVVSGSTAMVAVIRPVSHLSEENMSLSGVEEVDEDRCETPPQTHQIEDDRTAGEESGDTFGSNEDVENGLVHSNPLSLKLEKLFIAPEVADTKNGGTSTTSVEQLASSTEETQGIGAQVTSIDERNEDENVVNDVAPSSKNRVRNGWWMRLKPNKTTKSAQSVMEVKVKCCCSSWPTTTNSGRDSASCESSGDASVAHC